LQAKQYNVDEMATLVDEQRAIFNLDQATAFDAIYHKWSLTICDGCFDTLKSSKMRS